MDNPTNKIEPGYFTPYTVDLFGLTNEASIGDYANKFRNLPELVSKVVFDFSTAEFIEDKLGQTFGLSFEQKTELTRIIRDILLADAFWGDFPTLVSSRLGIGVDMANQIVKAITTELFAPAMEDIKKMQREKFSDKIAQSKNNQAPPTQQSTSAEQGNVINLRDK